MLNPVPLLSQARNPRALIKINEHLVRKIDSIEYIENNYYLADSFHVKMPIYDLSDAINIEYWLSQPAILVELFVGFPKDPINYGIQDLQSLVVGGINNLECKIFDNGGCIEFDGFDLSKKFIDNKTIDKYVNLTSSEIVTKFALKRGLTPVVTATQTKVDYYYNQDYVRLGSDITEWDLMTYLAQKEGFQIFVRGMSLYFQRRPITTNNPYLLPVRTLENGQMASFDGQSIIVSRNLNYARDVIVKIRGWNAKTGRVEVSAKSTPNKKTALAAAAQPIGEAETFAYRIDGISKEQAQQLAQKMLEDITLHERLLQFSRPADNLLHKDSIIKLAGVSQSADQLYYPDTITRRMSPTEGYIMDVRAKNHSPQSTVII